MFAMGSQFSGEVIVIGGYFGLILRGKFLVRRWFFHVVNHEHWRPHLLRFQF